jgi:hypothetical protein
MSQQQFPVPSPSLSTDPFIIALNSDQKIPVPDKQKIIVLYNMAKEIFSTIGTITNKTAYLVELDLVNIPYITDVWVTTTLYKGQPVAKMRYVDIRLTDYFETVISFGTIDTKNAMDNQNVNYGLEFTNNNATTPASFNIKIYFKVIDTYFTFQQESTTTNYSWTQIYPAVAPAPAPVPGPGPTPTPDPTPTQDP